MIISSWNINSVRIRTEIIKNYLVKEKIDILLLQEIKCQTDQFPFKFFNDLGYECYVSGQKSYNGVAIISKCKLNNIDNTNHIDKSMVNNLLNRLGQWRKDLKIRQYYYDV